MSRARGLAVPSDLPRNAQARLLPNTRVSGRRARQLLVLSRWIPPPPRRGEAVSEAQVVVAVTSGDLGEHGLVGEPRDGVAATAWT
jgi:hypothetical protein